MGLIHCMQRCLWPHDEHKTRHKVDLCIISSQWGCKLKLKCESHYAPSSKTRKNKITVESVGVSQPAWEVKLLCSLVVRQQILLYLLPIKWTDCGWGGCCLSVSYGLCADISPHQYLFTNWVTMMIWITRCRASMSLFMMFPVWMLSIDPL